MEIKRVGSKELEFIEDTYVDAENVRSARFPTKMHFPRFSLSNSKISLLFGVPSVLHIEISVPHTISHQVLGHPRYSVTSE